MNIVGTIGCVTDGTYFPSRARNFANLWQGYWAVKAVAQLRKNWPELNATAPAPPS
jgi:hypothetical protein